MVKECIGYAGEGTWDLVQSGRVGKGEGIERWGYVGGVEGVLNAGKGRWKWVFDLKVEPFPAFPI